MRPAPQSVQVLCQPIHALDGVLVRPTPNVTPARPLALRLLQALREARKAALMVLDGLHEPLVTRLLQPFLEEERVGEEAKQRRERVEGLGHVGLEVGGGGDGPDEEADEVGDEGAGEDDEGDLEERLEAALFDDAGKDVRMRDRIDA